MLKPQVNPQNASLTELQLLQEEACVFAKSLAGFEITVRYPLYKQLNVLAQGDDPAKTEMIQFINARRTDCDAMEAAINACATIDDLATLPFLARWVAAKINGLPNA